MARCTDAEWAQMADINPCLCPFRECLMQAAEAQLACNTAVLNKYRDIITLHPEDVEAMMAEYAECRALHTSLLRGCSDEFRNCAGLPPLPPDAPSFAADHKRRLSRGSSIAADVAGVLAFGAVASVSIPALVLGSVGAGAVGAGVAFCILAFATNRVGGALRDAALDPPNPDFSTITRPSRLILPPITPAGELTQPLAARLNAVVANYAESAGFARAVVTALEKAQGAELADDRAARDRQLTASKEFAGAWAVVLELSAGLRAAAANMFGEIFGTEAIPLEEVTRLRSEIVSSGWPTLIRDQFRNFTSGGESVEGVLESMTAHLLDTSALTVSLADALRAPILAGVEVELATAIREFSTS